MSRRVVTYKVPAEPGNRDSNKTFVLTEMPADEGERWVTQALFLMKGAKDANDSDQSLMRALQDPSLEALWKCVQYQHNPQHPAMPITSGESSVIEEISTRTALRLEVLKLHLQSTETKGEEQPKGAPVAQLPTRRPPSPPRAR